jgi:hypothetical protein
MMVSRWKYLNNADLARLIASFSKYLTCCKVDLQFGSRLCFDLGPMFERQIKPGIKVLGGSSTLILEGYEWKIFDSKRELVAHSEMVFDKLVKEILDSIFLNAKLKSLRFNKDIKELRVHFSNGFFIVSAALISGEYIDDNLCLWVLPDGRVLSCDAQTGFYSDGSVSKAHANHYASA